MSPVDPTYRVVIYHSPQVCKNEEAVQRILDYVSQEKSTLLRCMRRSRIFMIEALTRENAEA